MDILGIETSCDETAAAVVRDGSTVLANVVYTQIPLHQPYGGVVPEIASRAHVEKITEVVETALAKYREAVGASDATPDAVAVTYGPGLSPALIVGLNAAKGLAMSLGVPLIGINHIEAHLHTPFLRDLADAEGGRPEPPPEPMLGLAISGGHTNWIDMSRYGSYETIGQTLDDAAGEAFDKAAKLLGLGYPGGPKVDKIARAYRANFPDAEPIPFPKGRPREGVTALAGLDAALCVSFSGLKTSLLRYVQQHPEVLASDPGAARLDYAPGTFVPVEVARVVASYQEAIVQAVADRSRTALRRRNYRAFVVGGGVSLNSRLREVLAPVAAEAGVPLLLAKPKYCGDNGAMIAGLAYYRRNLEGSVALRLDVAPSLDVG